MNYDRKEPPNGAKESTAVREPATGEQLEKTEQNIENRMSAFERATIRLTRLGIFVGVLTAIIFAGQLYEMYEAGTQTDQMIKAANINAQAAGSFAKAAGEINTEVTNAVTQLGLQVGALRDNVKQTNGLAAATKDGIAENRDAIRLENRAWLGVTDERMIQFVAGKPIKIDIYLVNSGRTPANSVESAADVKAEVEVIGIPLNLKSFASTASVPPQGSRVVHIISNGILTGIQAAQIKNKSLFLVVSGTVDYEDFNRVPRSTDICMYMRDPDSKELVFCKTGNDMD